MRRHMRVSALKRGSARFALPQIVPGLPGQMEPCSAWTASSGLRARPRLSSSCLKRTRSENGVGAEVRRSHVSHSSSGVTSSVPSRRQLALRFGSPYCSNTVA
jgi:hypothetical protein